MVRLREDIYLFMSSDSYLLNFRSSVNCILHHEKKITGVAAQYHLLYQFFKTFFVVIFSDFLNILAPIANIKTSKCEFDLKMILYMLEIL